MNVLTALFYFFINRSFGEDNLVKIFPSQSATNFYDIIFLIQPSEHIIESNIKLCTFTSDSLNDFGCYSYYNMEGMFSNIFDYQFLNPPGSLKSKNSTFAFGSIKHSYLDKMNATVNSRFGLFSFIDYKIIKEQYRFMAEPSFSSFPDIEYGVSLIGNLDIYKSTSDAALYILGGAKFYSNNRTIQMINSFTSYSFSKGIWEDFSDKLPNSYEPVAGHKMINIDNEKLVVLGGYRTNNYTYSFEGNITAVNPQFSGFKKILIFDIKQQKWEYKPTDLSEEDKKMLETRKQYSCAAVHRKNKLYVYPGFYTDSTTNSIIHFFGVLDLNNMSWKWKKIQLDNMGFYNYSNAMNFDSILIQNYMLISHSDTISTSFKRFIGFDIDKEDITTDIIFNSSDLQDLSIKIPIRYTGRYLVPVYDDLLAFLCSVAALVILIISYLLYRYYKHDREFKGYVPRFETDQIWSDSDLKFYNNQKDFLYGEKTSNMNPCANIEHFDSLVTTNVPNFGNENNRFWNKSTVYKPASQCSQCSLQAIATLIQPPESGNTELSRASGSTRKWDPCSTY